MTINVFELLTPVKRATAELNTSQPVQIVKAMYCKQSSKPIAEAINLPRTPKNAPEVTELFVADR